MLLPFIISCGHLVTFYLGKYMQFMHCRWILGSLKAGWQRLLVTVMHCARELIQRVQKLFGHLSNHLQLLLPDQKSTQVHLLCQEIQTKFCLVRKNKVRVEIFLFVYSQKISIDWDWGWSSVANKNRHMPDWYLDEPWLKLTQWSNSPCEIKGYWCCND